MGDNGEPHPALRMSCGGFSGKGPGAASGERRRHHAWLIATDPKRARVPKTASDRKMPAD